MESSKSLLWNLFISPLSKWKLPQNSVLSPQASSILRLSLTRWCHELSRLPIPSILCQLLVLSSLLHTCTTACLPSPLRWLMGLLNLTSRKLNSSWTRTQLLHLSKQQLHSQLVQASNPVWGFLLHHLHCPLVKCTNSALPLCPDSDSALTFHLTFTSSTLSQTIFISWLDDCSGHLMGLHPDSPLAPWQFILNRVTR